uniref:KxDL domain-containing protein n=1 Tax=Mesocestoides corti TaxID=53468 RepID=A0A5K3FZ24_MESCO
MAVSTLQQLENLERRLNIAVKFLQPDENPATPPHATVDRREAENIVAKYDPSMVVRVREVFTEMDRIAAKLKSVIGDLKKLQEEWRLYASDVDAFRTWLLDRLSLSALGGRGNALASVRQAGERLQRLRHTYRKLTQNALSVDPILEKLDEQYQDLLYRLSRHEGH